MRRFLVLVLLISLGAVTSAAADSAVSCVQEQLTALGENPGPVDGQFGRKSALALAALRAREPERIAALDLPELSAKTAASWCAGLGGAFPEAGPIHARYKDDLESGFTFDVAPDVPEPLVAEIKQGLAIARAYIAKTFGAEIPLEIRRRMVVKIVATGKGNTERGGGGGVATAFSEAYDVPRPFFDVAHEQWSQNTSGRGWSVHADNMKSVVHEYTHGWQMVLGAIDIHHQPLGNWINEGLAEYVGYSAMADAGLIEWRDAQIFMTRSASGVETEYPLAQFGSTQTPAWAGHVGFVALDWLMTDTGTGIAAIKTLAERVAAGRTQKQAFADTFGLDIDDFYAQFDEYAKAIRQNPDRALARRPKLVLASSGGASKAAGGDPLAAEKCVQAALNSAGYKVGAVDGQIGNGTRAGFEKYRGGLDGMARSLPFEKGTYSQWCLLMTGNAPLTGDAAGFQAQIEQGATVQLGFKVPEGARFRVLMRRGDEVLAERDSPEWDQQAGAYHADFDYGPVRQADNVCAVFKDGWLVKDRAGKTYEASCDQIMPAMAAGARIFVSYDLAAPAPAPAGEPAGNVVVSRPAFPDLKAENDMLVDMMDEPMLQSGDVDLESEDLARLIVGKTVVVRYLPGKSIAEIEFGQDGSFRFVFDGEPRGSARSYTIHPRGWVCLHRENGDDAGCEKYVSNGGDIYRLKAVDGRLKVEIEGGQSAAQPKLQKLATKGDPNPGLELIPQGWNGIYRTAELKDGSWNATKYSGEVDTYRSCKLLNDTYIICQ